jgi:hypothetical protein
MTAILVPDYPVDSAVYHRLHDPLTFAYHEAGHACVATAFGIRVTRLTIKLCCVHHIDGRAGSWAQAVTALSGPFAEQRFARYPEDVRAELWRSYWRTDRANALEHLRRSRRWRTLADVETLATTLVAEHWPAIVCVAEDLAAEGELSGASIEALIQGSRFSDASRTQNRRGQ